MNDDIERKLSKKIHESQNFQSINDEKAKE